MFSLSSTSAKNPIQKIRVPLMNLDELDALVASLIMNFELEQRQLSLKSQTLCNETTEAQGGQIATMTLNLLGNRREFQNIPTDSSLDLHFL